VRCHNLAKLMLDEIKGHDRQKFIEEVEAKHVVKIGAVPESKRADIEKLIGEWGAGCPLVAAS
jgi:hypothetical protein